MSLGMLDPVILVLVIPAVAAAILALLPSYKIAARLNVLATMATVARMRQKPPARVPSSPRDRERMRSMSRQAKR